MPRFDIWRSNGKRDPGPIGRKHREAESEENEQTLPGQVPEPQDITLVAITGWGQEQDRRRTMEGGFDYHLTKPVNPEVLQRLLDGLERGPEVAARMPGPATA